MREQGGITLQPQSTLTLRTVVLGESTYTAEQPSAKYSTKGVDRLEAFGNYDAGNADLELNMHIFRVHIRTI